MTDPKKSLVDEADPASLNERQHDEPGSFLDIYRSLSLPHVPLDSELVDKSVMSGIIPKSLRYGCMRRGDIDVYRGVIKSTAGEFHYFNWTRGTEFKIVPADTAEKQGEAARLFKSCEYGCDMAGSVDEDDEDEAKAVPGVGVAPQQEDQWMAQQETMAQQAHPGAATATTPDDPNVGRDWHKAQPPLRSVSDGLEDLAAGDGVQHWNKAGLLKAWATELQQTAPSVAPRFDPVEAKYAQEVLGASEQDVQKGFRLAPRHRVAFEQWKSSRLRNNISSLQKWLENK